MRASQGLWKDGFAAATSIFTIAPKQLDIAGDIAVDRFGWTMDTTPHEGGDTMRDEGACVWMWRRVNGSWKLDCSIWNSDLAEPGIWAGA